MKILVIRRDNIGDLLCTTPLLASLRQTYPQAWIGVLANSYNAPALAGNPDVDAVFAYCKGKHRAAGESLLGVWWRTVKMLVGLRRRRLDLILVASAGGSGFARWIGARRIIAQEERGGGHEVERTQRLLQSLGPVSAPGPMRLVADAAVRARLQAALPAVPGEGLRLALHVSARKPSQRWPEDRFVELVRRLLERGVVRQVLLFWAPGAEDDPLHPGDDAKAGRIMAALAGLPVAPVPTRHLEELIAGLSLADVMLCADGGAMHVAAAQGKPVLALFGKSSVEQWQPWAVPRQVLQSDSQDVADLDVETVEAAFLRLTGAA